MCFFVFIFKNLLWGSVKYGQSLHGLHNTKSLRTPALRGDNTKVKSMEHQRVGTSQLPGSVVWYCNIK